MSKDYERGFEAGFEAGFRAANKLQRDTLPTYAPYPYPFTYKNQDSSRCSVCGFTFEHGKIYGYVCGNAKCPSKATSSVGTPV